MNEKKLTDEEIVKALEICSIEVEIHDLDDCKECPYFIKKIDCVTGKRSEKDFLDLINRQNTEIERLTEERDRYKEKWQTAYMNELNLQKQVDELKLDLENWKKAAYGYKYAEEQAVKDTAKEILQGFNKWLKQAISDSYEIAVLNSGGFHGGRNRAFHEVKDLVKKVAESKGVEVE